MPIDSRAIPWLLAVVFSCAAPHAFNLPWWLSVFGTALLGIRFWAWREHRALPKRALVFLFLVLGVACIYLAYRTLLGRDAGVALLFFFMCLKPLEAHNTRDAIVIIMLGFFLMLTHYLFSQDILVGLWLFFTTILLVATLMRLHGGTQATPILFKNSLSILLQSLPFMVAFFFLFPRVEGPLWGLPRDAHAGLTGLSDSMSPGSLNNLIQSGEIAFRVRFDDQIPKQQDLYWRGPVLSDYDGRRWRAVPFISRSRYFPTTIEFDPALPSIDYTITLEPHNQRWLLALDLPTKLPADAMMTPSFEARTRDPITERKRLQFSSVTDFIANRQEANLVLDEARYLPKNNNPRAVLLAQSWRDTHKTPEKISEAALSFFREEQFFYTLQPALLEGELIDDFLFNTRKGFCEHFASAYVFLMRAADIPARVVTGYQGGTINPVDGYLTVRQSDAHAWAEIWIANQGWIRVDPTAAVAPSRIQRGINAALPGTDPLPDVMRLQTSWLIRLNNNWEALNNAWNQWVLGYNKERQEEILARLGWDNFNWKTLSIALVGVCLVLLSLMTLWALFHRHKEPEAQRLWRHACEHLAHLGFTRAPWEGPLAFGERITHHNPRLGKIVQILAHSFVETYYGTETKQALQRLKGHLRVLKRYR